MMNKHTPFTDNADAIPVESNDSGSETSRKRRSKAVESFHMFVDARYRRNFYRCIFCYQQFWYLDDAK